VQSGPEEQESVRPVILCCAVQRSGVFGYFKEKEPHLQSSKPDDIDLEDIKDYIHNPATSTDLWT
jgi:hypothetical protein